jgi:hypothetical protein
MEKDFLALVAEYELSHNVSRVQAMIEIVRMFPAKHEEYLQMVNSPQYRSQFAGKRAR